MTGELSCRNFPFSLHDERVDILNRLSNRVALITGVGTGIGRATALAMAREGADLILNDLASETNQSHLEDLAELIRQQGRRVRVHFADVSNRMQMEELFAASVEEMGAIDIALANAAFSVKKRIVDTEWTEAQRMIDVILDGTFHTCQLAAQQMISQHEAGRSGGKILITGSIHAELAMPFHGVYAMAKAAGMRFCQSLAAELVPYRINVNSINPGWIDTPNERNFISEAEIQAVATELPWQRLGKPDEIAEAFVYLASSEADYITGQTLVVDGGLRLDTRSITKGLE